MYNYSFTLLEQRFKNKIDFEEIRIQPLGNSS